MLSIRNLPSLQCMSLRRSLSSSPKTGILFLNMGGPSKSDEVEDFLTRLFLDRDIIKLPFQKFLGPWIAKRRSSSIIEKYNEIGGGSPILQWTKRQGEMMCRLLDEMSPKTAPHKSYVGFRYASPLTEDTVREMEKDGIKTAVAFSQYPQYSCTTSGSSMNALYLYLSKNPSKMNWSFIDRWGTHPGLIQTFADNIKKELSTFEESKRKDVVLLFSAHSLPQYVMDRGDTYPSEVGATVQLVMESLGFSHPYRLVWQSKVGPLPWLKPKTDDVIKALVKRGHKNLMLIPIAFVNEHIETLHEMDIEYAKELGEKLGAHRIARCCTPNTHPFFIQGLADIVFSHLSSCVSVFPQLLLQCPFCTNPLCAPQKSWLKKIASQNQSLLKTPIQNIL